MPENWTNGRILLDAEMIQSAARCFLDGKFCGELYYPGGSLDLSGKVTPGKEHELVLLLVARPDENSTKVYVSYLKGMLEELSKELIKGGYSPDTPAAIVYKATWPDEKTLPCTVETLARTAEENQVTKTALIVVGHVLDSAYDRSELYNPAFSTEFRKAEI